MNCVIITAGGIGARMKTALPKQFLLLAGKPMLMHSIEKFYISVPDIKIIVVLPENQKQFWIELCEKYKFEIKHEIVFGGKTRFESVKNGLKSVKTTGITAVHDAVRPLISPVTIKLCFEKAKTNNTAVPFHHITDSIRKITKLSSKIVNRNKYKSIATPQVFKTEILKKAYNQNYTKNFTDSSSVVEKTGIIIHLIESNKENIKITTPTDLIIAEVLFKNLQISKKLND